MQSKSKHCKSKQFSYWCVMWLVVAARFSNQDFSIPDIILSCSFEEQNLECNSLNLRLGSLHGDAGHHRARHVIQSIWVNFYILHAQGKSRDISPASEALDEVRVYNNLQEQRLGGPQADTEPSGGASGSKPAKKKKGNKEEKIKCAGRDCTRMVRKVHTAHDLWSCHMTHEGLCLTCWKKQDGCPVCAGGYMMERNPYAPDEPPND